MIWFTGVLVVVYLLGTFLAARGYLRPIRWVPVTPIWVEEVKIPTSAGPNPAWVTLELTKKPHEVVFVLAHGYGGNRQTWSGLMREFGPLGWSAVAPCMPGQDASPAPEVGFGKKEAETIVETVAWVRKVAPRSKVVLMGLSMGGAASWLASEADPSVDAVVTDAAFARFDEAMNAFLSLRVKGGDVILHPVVWFARGMSGLDPTSIVPLDSALKWRKPALVIQGADDTLVAPSHAQRLAAASGAELWMVPGAHHAQCFEVDSRGYLRHLEELVKRIPLQHEDEIGDGPGAPHPSSAPR